MKSNRMYVDIGAILDEVFEAAKDFGEKMKDIGPDMEGEPWQHKPRFDDENADYYPAYSFPPMNIYLTSERSIVFEFALAGFAEKDIVLTFQGDYMVFREDRSRGGGRGRCPLCQTAAQAEGCREAEVLRSRRQVRPGSGQGCLQERNPQGHRPSQGFRRGRRGDQDRDSQRVRLSLRARPGGRSVGRAPAFNSRG